MLDTDYQCEWFYDTRGKGKGKFLPITGHEGPEGEQKYILPSNSVLDGGEWSMSRLGRFYLQERPGTHCIGGWVGPRAGLYGCGKSHPHRDLIPGPSSP